ncbi:hypothetical protein COU18_00690 [Candidatus Kaiserbacteria bacterium CG10_big_fil_rev_8_21_14_0_10_51_14]|uniref:Uncharacterized protein n=1 Tax=Candidatus Kaiserbacteria bacterium CG10_big_fil_rev_8_21_14_0_10_51_14 TaxID=1974610 RepID=A0A2H0UBX6_9BACT|nr:MAG: hypothetical protein COU18_00690 [Candidatus Kaiserbacteria bacterium CG10_big_fil_rev_8_21_14_0_10_51_14]
MMNEARARLAGASRAINPNYPWTLRKNVIVSPDEMPSARTAVATIAIAASIVISLCCLMYKKSPTWRSFCGIREY